MLFGADCACGNQECQEETAVSLARIVVTVALVVFAASCGAKYAAQTRLDETLLWYRTALERGDVEATGMLAADSIAPEYLQRARAAKDVRIVECRVLKVDYVEAAGEAEVTLEIEYYSLETLKARKIREVQKWVYVGDKSSAPWKLTTVLPRLK